MLTRRTLLKALAVGLASGSLVRAATCREDERPLWLYPGVVPLATDEGLDVPVRIILPPGHHFDTLRRITGRFVDRPLFGLAPKTCQVVTLHWDRDYAGEWNVTGVVRSRELDPRIDSLVAIAGVDRCDDVTFIPFGRA